MTKRVATTLALVVLVGCEALSAPVPLLISSGVPTCFVNNVNAPLVTDPTYGTAVLDPLADGAIPLAWPAGYTGRGAGSEVEVFDRQGNLVAVTGRNYLIQVDMCIRAA